MPEYGVRKRANVPREKDKRIVVLGEITSQLRYLSRYAKVLLMPFPPDSPVFTTTLKLIVKLTSTILLFRPHIILVYPSCPFGLSSALISRLFRKVCVSFTGGPDFKRRTRLGKLLVSLTVKLSHGFICDCEALAKLARRMGGRNVVTIPMGIDTSGIPSQQPRKLRNTVVCVINFNLAYSKGVDLLIRAVKELPKARLILIGEGTQRGAMISLTRKLNVSDRVTFTGYISHEELWNYLLKASLFAMASRASFMEGLNRAKLEAMFCGLPVVVTRTGGLPELVVEGVNGFVVEPGDVKGLVRAIKTLLKNPELRKRMGRTNKFKAKKYSVDVLTAKRYEYLAMLTQGA